MKFIVAIACVASVLSLSGCGTPINNQYYHVGSPHIAEHFDGYLTEVEVIKNDPNKNVGMEASSQAMTSSGGVVGGIGAAMTLYTMAARWDGPRYVLHLKNGDQTYKTVPIDLDKPGILKVGDMYRYFLTNKAEARIFNLTTHPHYKALTDAPPKKGVSVPSEPK